MTHLTPATARALKAAGFPQPAPEIEQNWYKDDTRFNLSTAVMSGGKVTFNDFKGSFEAEMAYCPTAEEILNLLPSGCRAGKAVDAFEVIHYRYDATGIALIGSITTYKGATLAEALATAYLALHPTPAP